MQKRYTLSTQQQEQLRGNPNVKSVSARMVQYTAEFKRQVLQARTQGHKPRDEFIRAGIPLEWFGKGHVKSCVRAWTQLAKKYGTEYFDTEHRGNDGLPLKNWRDKKQLYEAMTDTQKVEYLEAEVEALEYIRRHFQLPPSIH
jgi:transposase